MYSKNIKKLVLIGIVLINCLSFSEVKAKNIAKSNVQNIKNINNTSSENNISNTSVMVVSKSDSFMSAFGMGDSRVVGGESSGETNSNSSSPVSQSNSAIAGSVITSGASSLTNIQNTPYMPR
ncbi:hypothetical protein [Cetobacterium sp.]|uniref:hypothetical protein n=1 Tax=Cetobacterium sp. TaxID=2071632 RepID=UPI003F30228C